MVELILENLYDTHRETKTAIIERPKFFIMGCVVI